MKVQLFKVTQYAKESGASRIELLTVKIHTKNLGRKMNFQYIIEVNRNPTICL